MEACTYRNTETRVPIGQPCKYWLDGNGRIASGGKSLYQVKHENYESNM
jgi:hypothetical protein